MARGPKTKALVLTGEERAALRRLVRRRGAGQAAVMRARVVFMADAEPAATNRLMADRLGVSRQSVVTWRQRFVGLASAVVVENPGRLRRPSDRLAKVELRRFTPMPGGPDERGQTTFG